MIFNEFVSNSKTTIARWVLLRQLQLLGLLQNESSILVPAGEAAALCSLVLPNQVR